MGGSTQPPNHRTPNHQLDPIRGVLSAVGFCGRQDGQQSPVACSDGAMSLSVCRVGGVTWAAPVEIWGKEIQQHPRYHCSWHDC